MISKTTAIEILLIVWICLAIFLLPGGITGMAVLDSFNITVNEETTFYIDLNNTEYNILKIDVSSLNAVNPSVDILQDGVIDWSFDGEFNSTSTIDFNSLISDYLSNCFSYPCNVPFYVKLDLGEIEFSNLVIEVGNESLEEIEALEETISEIEENMTEEIVEENITREILQERQLVGYSGQGSGTAANPYNISNCSQLQEMANDLAGYYQLNTSFNCHNTTEWNGFLGFDPIDVFTGQLNGRNYTISNLFINRTGMSVNVGLFGDVDTSTTISNLGLINITVRGGDRVGALVYSNSGTVNNCYAIGNVSGNGSTAMVGGLVSQNFGSIKNSYFSGNVSGNGTDLLVGGLVSQNFGSIFNSYFIGNISGNVSQGALGSSSFGCLVSDNYAGGYINNSFASCNISIQADTSIVLRTGGLIGYQNNGVTTNSYMHNMSDLFGCSFGGITGCTAIADINYFKGSVSHKPPFNNTWDFNYINGTWEENATDFPKLMWQDLGGILLAGIGTTASPFNISNCGELQAMQNNLTSQYQLINNISCAETSNWNSGAGFAPVGIALNTFNGSLDGRNYTVNTLFINRTGENNIGLFGNTGESIIKNIGLKEINITGQNKVGGLVGTGGPNISFVVVSGNLSVVNDYAGGLVGFLSAWGVINDSYSYVNVSDTPNGGIAENDYIGSFIGDNDGKVNRSFSYGNLIERDGFNLLVGGFIGTNDGVTQNSFYTGTVPVGSTSYGFTGFNVGSLINCYWYKPAGITGNPASCYNGGSTGCTSTSDLDYFKGDIYPLLPPFDTWSFFTTWQERANNYPSLTWQALGGSIARPNVSSVVLNSTDLTANSTSVDLKCYANITDANDYNVYVNYTWYNNSVEITHLKGQSSALVANRTNLISTLNNPNTTKNQNWTCYVQGYDLSDYNGNWTNSSNLTILNTLPNTTSVILNSTNPLTNDTLQNLTCYANITDIDGDNVYANYTWYNKTVESTEFRGQSGAFTQAILTSVRNLTSGNTTLADIWRCSVHAYDGETYETDWTNSSNLTILQYCGDALCDGTETPSSCSADCGTCGNGACDGGETCSSCVTDCACSTGYTCNSGTCVSSSTPSGGGTSGASGAAPAVAAVVTVTTETAETTTETTTETAQTTETTESAETGETGQATDVLSGQTSESVPTAQTGEVMARPPAEVSVTFTNTGTGVINNPRATIVPIQDIIVEEGDPFYFEDERYKTTTDKKEILYEDEKELASGVRVFNNEDGTYASFNEDGTYSVYNRDGTSYILDEENFKEYNKKAVSIVGQPWIITIMDQQGNQAETEFVGTEEQMNNKKEELVVEYPNAEIVPELKKKFLEDEELVLLHTKKITGTEENPWTALSLKENIKDSSLLEWEISQPEELESLAPGEKMDLNLNIIPPLTTKKTADLKLKLYSGENIVYEQTVTVQIDRSNFEAVADVHEDEKILDMFMIISNTDDVDKDYSIELNLDSTNKDNTMFAEYYGPIRIKAKDTQMFAYKYDYSQDVEGEHILKYLLYENGKLIKKVTEDVELGK